MGLISRNPTTGQRLAVHREHTRADIERSVSRAETAQPRWQALGFARRAKHFRSVARALLAQGDELAALATAEMGKPIVQARAELEKSTRLCDYYAKHAAQMLADEHP
ncbi:MAG: aldehyde dehydrogenase family protein, partial [Opitutaceae bacterium]